MPEVANRLKFLNSQQYRRDYPLFVFLPGMDGSGRLLQTQTETLEKRFDVRCLAIPPDDLNDWDILAAHVVDLIRAELESEPNRCVYLCGESFGGCLALKVAVRSPELFDKIILVNPASSFNKRPLLHFGAQLLPWMPDFVYRGASFSLLPFLVTWKKVQKSDRRALLDVIRSVPPKSVGWRLSLLGEFGLKDEDLHRLKQPMLILAGAADRVLPSVDEAQSLVKRFPNAQMVVLPKSGHACLLEADVNFYKIMQDSQFLDELVTND